MKAWKSRKGRRTKNGYASCTSVSRSYRICAPIRGSTTPRDSSPSGTLGPLAGVLPDELPLSALFHSALIRLTPGNPSSDSDSRADKVGQDAGDQKQVKSC